MSCWMKLNSYDGLEGSINTTNFQNEKASFRKAEIKLQTPLDTSDNSLVKWTSAVTETAGRPTIQNSAESLYHKGGSSGQSLISSNK